jgi:SNF2 family DNA or RNA helicase
MHVLHAHWRPPEKPADSEQLLLWAETNQPSQVEIEKHQRHPFSADVASLWRLLEPLNLPLGGAAASEARLWLPSTSAGPLPSPQLQADREKPAEVSFRPWIVCGLALPPAEVTLLVKLAEAPGLRLGSDLRYWQTAAYLVHEALAQHKLRPGLEPIPKKKGVYLARWYPVLDGPKDSPRLAELARRMPPLCRAEATDPEAPPVPLKLLESFLTVATDALARRWAKSPTQTLDPAEPAHRWLLMLFANEATVSGSTEQLSHLYQAYQGWQRQLQLAGDANFRVALRLVEPAEPQQPWTIHFLLQAKDDPSLLVRAADVWQAKGNLLENLGRRFEGAQEKLLAGLGYAARLFEPLRRGLASAKPEGVALSADEAFGFLREVAPLLEESGFGVLVPPWWTRPSARLGLRLKISSQPSGGVAEGLMKLRHLVQYRWELALGDADLSQEEFEALVALKSPLVQVRGAWVRLDPEQVEAAVRFFEKREQARETTLLEALQLGLGGTESLDHLALEEVSFEGEIAEWVKRLEGERKIEQLEAPKTLKGTLRPYQQVGISWLAFMKGLGLGACLADDMGLGKSIQALALLLHEQEAGRLDGPVLLISPTSVVTNWRKECERFAPSLRTLVHQGADRLKGKRFKKKLKETDLVLTSYTLVRRDAELLKGNRWYGVILDEAQNVKNPGALQSRVIKGLQTGFRLALTGTPVENRLMELWSIMNFLNPGYLGSRRAFRAQLAAPIEREGDEAALRQLRRLTAPFILRRHKTDRKVIQDLPDKIENRVYCQLSQEQATLYESVVRDALGDIEGREGIERQGLVLSMLTKLKQICNHPAQFLHEGASGQADGRSAKLTRLVELLEETLSVGDKSLIFTQFTEMGAMLARYLPERLGAGVQFLQGSTPAEKRHELIERFQANGDAKIFVLSLKAGGTGLNLTAANHVFHFDRWWNPAVENQATDRAFRIGQRRNVQVHKFVCVGTLEERIDEMMEAKKGLAESVVGAGEGWVTELSTEALRELVSLRREALA